VDLLKQPSQDELNKADDYTRTITKQIKKIKTSTSARGKRDVPQLGEQANQSIPHLKVLPEDVPQQQGVDMKTVTALAAQMGVSVEQLLSDTVELPKAVVARRYVRGEPLVSDEKYRQLPTHLRNLHDWYMDAAKDGQTMLVADLPEEYYFREETIHIEFPELFQLFNLDALDKSLVSCYCL
jgi:hypothetical protein